jgi:hypothetical protein
MPFGKTFSQAAHGRARLGLRLGDLPETPVLLPITATTRHEPTQATWPTYSFTGAAHITANGAGVYRRPIQWSFVQRANSSTTQSSANQFIDVSSFVQTPANVFGNTARTAPYNIYSPGNYQLDLGLARSFPLHLGESSRLSLRAELYNVTNHTFFAVASTVWGNSNFGQVTQSPSYNRRAAQLSGRIEF